MTKVSNFLAQLWRFSHEGHLENKMRRWSYSDSKASIDPKDAQEGFIEIHEIGKLLTLKDEITKKVGFEEKSTSMSSSQTWKLGPERENGWRTIVHSKSGLYLTTRLTGKFSSLTVAAKGMHNNQNEYN